MLLVKFWNPGFHSGRTKTKKETDRMNQRRSEQPARTDLEQEGAAHPARRCESRTFVFTFSPGSLEANQTSLCQRTTLAHSWLLTSLRSPPLNRIIFCFWKEGEKKQKRQRRRLIGPFIRGECGLLRSLPVLLAARRRAFCGMAAGKRTGSGQVVGGVGGVASDVGHGARTGLGFIPSAGPY